VPQTKEEEGKKKEGSPHQIFWSQPQEIIDDQIDLTAEILKHVPPNRFGTDLFFLSLVLRNFLDQQEFRKTLSSGKNACIYTWNVLDLIPASVNSQTRLSKRLEESLEACFVSMGYSL
jgi:hypothetical protein